MKRKTEDMAELLDRLDDGPVICAEGYLFELERRGYLQAGGFVPEVVLEHPEKVAELHREFVHAGSDVVEAFTYYAHREKLRLIGKEDLLEEINRQALGSPRTWPPRAARWWRATSATPTSTAATESSDTVRRMFEEQVGWAAEAGVDFVIAETISWLGEALIATEVIKRGRAAGRGHAHRPRGSGDARGRGARPRPASAWRRPVPTSSASTAAAGRGRCCRCSRRSAKRWPCPWPRCPCPTARPRGSRASSRCEDPRCAGAPGGRRVPDRARPVHVQPLRDRRLRPGGVRPGRPLPRRLLRRGPASHPQHGRGARAHSAGEPLQRRHVQARLPRHRPDAAGRLPRVRRAAVAAVGSPA